MQSFKRHIYKLSQFEDNERNPPTVDDNSSDYNSGIFTFDTSHFTNNFTDLDGDSYKFVKIISLPSIGTLTFNGNPVNEGFTFNISNIDNLVFEIPSNIMISEDKFCEFDKEIFEIVSEQQNDGFTLCDSNVDSLNFEKDIYLDIPTDADIYTTINVSGISVSEANTIKDKIQEWFNKTTKSGNLYFIPTVNNNWLNIPNIIWRGSSKEIGHPTKDYSSITKLPDSFDTSSNVYNSTWTPPTKLITIIISNSMYDTNKSYHTNYSFDGFKSQPTEQFKKDYNKFKTNYINNFEFFKGLFYPIVDINESLYNNEGNAIVLQGFSSIEGGSTYTSEEISNLGVSYVKERKFDEYLDPTNVKFTGNRYAPTNPYSIEFEPLKNLGWVGFYNKEEPINENNLNEDLSKNLQDNIIQKTEKRTIQGECTSREDICFNFQTSDDSQFLLYSNEAEMCINYTGENTEIPIQPQVDSVNRNLMNNTYQFVLEDFTKNFYDENQDSYLKGKLLTPFMSTSNIEIGDIRNSGVTIDYPFTFNLTNVEELTFNLSDNLYVVEDNLYEYTDDLNNLISNVENQGYSLKDYTDGEFTFSRVLNIDTGEYLESGYIEDGYLLSDPLNSSEDIIIKGIKLGKGEICTDFRTSDDSQYTLFSNIGNICLSIEPINTPPTIEGGSGIFTSTEFNFSEDDFTIEYSDNENDIAKTVSITSLIETDKGKFIFNGVEVNEPFSFNIDNSSSFIFLLNEEYTVEDEEIFLNGKTVITEEKCLTFKVSDNNEFPLFSNEVEFCLNIPTDEVIVENDNPPTVDNNTGTLENINYIFAEEDFTNNFQDIDGDSYKKVKINTLPEIGKLTVLGNEITEGTSFEFSNINNLQFKLNDSYAVYDGILYEFDQPITDVINYYESMNYQLTSNENGILIFSHILQENYEGAKAYKEIKYQGMILDNSQLCFKFATSDDSEYELYSNEAEFCLIPEGDINVKPIEINNPPTVGDNTIQAYYTETKVLLKEYFIDNTTPPYFDPEGNPPYKLRVNSLPEYGELTLRGETVEVGDELLFTEDINTGDFKYVPDPSQDNIENVSFDFEVSDTGSQQYGGAMLNINILIPRIALVENTVETSNSCVTLFEFELNTTQGNSLDFIIEKLNSHNNDYDSIELDTGEGYNDIESEEFTATFPNGEGRMKIKIGNVTTGVPCNEVEVNINDVVNNNSETTVYQRCIKAERC